MGVSAVFCVYLPRLHFTQDDFEMKKLLLPLLLAAFAVGVSSCSDDKIPGDPEGTVTLNMMDEKSTYFTVPIKREADFVQLFTIAVDIVHSGDGRVLSGLLPFWCQYLHLTPSRLDR